MTGGNKFEPTPKIKAVDSISFSDKAGLENALTPDSFVRAKREGAVAYSKEAYSGEKGKIFEAEDGSYLALTKSNSEGKAVIQELYVEKSSETGVRNPAVVRQLLERALAFLRDETPVNEVTIHVSDMFDDVEHVIHELGFHLEAQKDGTRTLKRTLH